MLRRQDIRVRDPFILLENGVYYMYATTGERTLSYYYGFDLENWEEGGVAFEIPENFWAYKDVWAAEVHKYRGRFYLFVSLLGKNGLRGTQVAVSDTPAGRFVPLADRAVTPLDESCIDGSLFVDGERPYIVYSHDWPNHYVEEKGAYVGEIWAAELSEDLTEIVGAPRRLFESDEVPISKATPHHIVMKGKRTMRYGSDAPFVQRLERGALFLTWSPYLNGNYVVLGALSESGDVMGPWEHLEAPVFDRNGGHAMFFDDKDGNRLMCIHAPEIHMQERAHLFRMEEAEGSMRILEEIGG